VLFRSRILRYYRSRWERKNHVPSDKIVVSISDDLLEVERLANFCYRVEKLSDVRTPVGAVSINPAKLRAVSPIFVVDTHKL
jgi:hypothetical protein